MVGNQISVIILVDFLATRQLLDAIPIVLAG